MLECGIFGGQLSFHVESEESMRCYFYIHGQCTRFMPADMKMLLPLFFEDSDANRKFAEGKVIMEWINDMETKLRGIHIHSRFCGLTN